MVVNSRAASMCLKGGRRRIEDSYYLNSDSGIFIVADGVAGAPNGIWLADSLLIILQNFLKTGFLM